MMDDEVVGRRRWLTREQFLDYVGAVNLIPGPNSTELAIHIGRARAGWPGLLVAGTSFILPAFAIVLAIAWAYTKYGSLPDAAAILYGVKPVMVAVVAQALWGLARSAVKSPWLAAIAVAATVAAASGVHELTVLAVAGLVAGLASAGIRPRTTVFSALAVSASTGVTASAAVAIPAGTAGLLPLFLVFVKTGAVLFGSGYVLLALLRADLVERLGWLTEGQLIDAIAVGQVTPGPVFTTATFVGYVLAGPWGAGVATVGIFLPAFVFVALSGPLVPRLRRSPLTSAVLDGVNVASLAMMAAVTFQLSATALTSRLPIVLAVVTAVILLGYRVNPTWLILAGGLAGWLFRM